MGPRGVSSLYRPGEIGSTYTLVMSAPGVAPLMHPREQLGNFKLGEAISRKRPAGPNGKLKRGSETR
jgi:hypothetical protein